MPNPSTVAREEMVEESTDALLDHLCDGLDVLRGVIVRERPLTFGEARTIIISEREQRTKAQILESVIKGHADYLWHDIEELFDKHPDIVYDRR